MTLILNGTDGLSDVDGSAATPAIRGTDANTGMFFPAADTIAFSEGGVESMRLDSSANLQFNSGYGSVATAFGCRAWVNFNGATNAIRTSGNVSSITDQGTGIWQISFSNTPPDANYSVQCLTSGQYNSAHTVAYVGAGNQDFAGYVPPAPTTSSFYILTCNPGNGGQRAEGTQMMVSVFR
jgi:hypothetical protein